MQKLKYISLAIICFMAIQYSFQLELQSPIKLAKEGVEVQKTLAELPKFELTENVDQHEYNALLVNLAGE